MIGEDVGEHIVVGRRSIDQLVAKVKDLDRALGIERAKQIPLPIDPNTDDPNR